MISLSPLGKLLSLVSATFLAIAFKIRNETLTFDHFVTLDDDELPPLSIAVAAKDEEKTIGAALRSLLELEYPQLEIVLVDDRSTDGTRAIAERLRDSHPSGFRLKVLACHELPPGWLGKVHALHLAVQACRHPLVLLTDADVHFSSDSLKRAVSIQQVFQCPHLVAAPHIITESFWEKILTGLFLVLFTTRFRPSLVHRHAKSFVGVGAFNLLTREALQGIDNLRPLRLQVIDDVHLGRLIKSRGFSQRCLLADSYVSVRWFEGLSGLVKGLEKNAYAGLGYKPVFALICILTLLAGALSPLLLALAGKSAWALAAWLFQAAVGLTIPRSFQIPRWVGFFFPLASLGLCYAFARSVWLTERQNGVRWRGTHYPLNELRRELHRFQNEEAPL